MNIYIGTQGIPLSLRAKGLNIVDCLYKLKELSLNALEFDFVYNIYLNNEQCKIIGDLARKLNIRLSIHAPYYINLLSESESIRNRSITRLLRCIERARNLGADAIAVHIAFYGKLNKEDAYKQLKKELSKIEDIDTLAIETMAKDTQFGTFDEIIRLYEDIGVKPYIDFAHIFARNNGKIDYSNILDVLEDHNIKHINAHFEGLKYKNDRYIDQHTPINQPPFEPLAIELINRKGNITIICESPLLELDCIKMINILNDLGYKWNHFI